MRRRRGFLAAAMVVAVLAVLAMVGCSSSGAVMHPGAVNAIDDQVYNGLLVAQAAIEASAPLAVSPSEKAAYNKAAAAYNTAMDAWKSYHAAAVAGKPPDPATLQAEFAQVLADVADLRKLLKPAASGSAHVGAA